MHYFIHQIAESDCGFACLKMTLAQAYHDERFLILANPKENGPYSFLELANLGKTYGLVLEGYRLSPPSEAFHLPVPYIARIDCGGSGHFVIVEKIRKNRVKVADPKTGVAWMPKKDFVKVFSGVLLAIAEKKKSPIRLDDFALIPVRQRIMLHVTQLLNLGFLLGALYFVTDNSSFIFPVALFVLYFISELLYKKFLIRILAQFDQRLIAPKVLALRNHVRECFSFLYEFKAKALATPLQFIGELASSLAVGILLVFNDWRNIFVAGGCLLVLSCDRWVIEPGFRRREKEMGKIEDDVIRRLENKQGDVEKRLSHLHRLSYRYALRMEMRKYVFWFLLLSGCLLSMALSGRASVNYLAFHFMAFLYFAQNVKSVIGYGDSRLTLRDMIARFRSLSD